MINYIKSELFRGFKTSYFRNIIIAISGLALLGILSFNMPDLPPAFQEVFEAGQRLLTLPIFLIPMFIDIVTIDDFKNNTIKNQVAQGNSRKKIIVGKLVSTFLLALIAAVIILTVFFAAGKIITIGWGEDFNHVFMEFTKAFAGSLSLWVGALSLGTLIAFITKSGNQFSTLYLVLIVLAPKLVNLISNLLKAPAIGNLIMKVDLYENLKSYIALDYISGMDLLNMVFLGLFYTLIYGIISIKYFESIDL